MASLNVARPSCPRGAPRILLAVLLAGVPLGGWSQLKVSTKTLKASSRKLYDAKVSYPVFQGTSPLIRFANSASAAEARNDFAQFVKYAKEGAKATQKFGMTWERDQSTVVVQATPTLISVYMQAYDFSGGAHPNHYLMPMNFAMVKGKPMRLKLKDLVANPKLAMNGPVLMKLNEVKKGRDGGSETSIDPTVYDSFVITPTSLTWMFQPYAVGAYAEGEFEIKVPFNELKSYLRVDSPVGRAG